MSVHASTAKKHISKCLKIWKNYLGVHLDHFMLTHKVSREKDIFWLV
jgi:hypothetical protein